MEARCSSDSTPACRCPVGESLPVDGAEAMMRVRRRPFARVRLLEGQRRSWHSTGGRVRGGGTAVGWPLVILSSWRACARRKTYGWSPEPRACRWPVFRRAQGWKRVSSSLGAQRRERVMHTSQWQPCGRELCALLPSARFSAASTMADVIVPAEVTPEIAQIVSNLVLGDNAIHPGY